MGTFADQKGRELNERLEVLSRLRTGNTIGAIQVLESGMDNLVWTLPQGKPFSHLSKYRQVGLRAAETYRTAFPPSTNSNPELLTLLREIPPVPIDHVFCSGAALTKVAEMTARGELPAHGPSHAH